VIVAEILPPSLMGDYHVGSGSSARGAGVVSTPALNAGQVTAPTSDIDGDPRPTVTGTGQTQTRRYDAGSDQMTP